jgi:hypothetical protein
VVNIEQPCPVKAPKLHAKPYTFQSDQDNESFLHHRRSGRDPCDRKLSRTAHLKHFLARRQPPPTFVFFLWMAPYRSATSIVRTLWSAWRRRALSRIVNLATCSIDLRCCGLFSLIRPRMMIAALTSPVGFRSMTSDRDTETSPGTPLTLEGAHHFFRSPAPAITQTKWQLPWSG